MAELSGVRRRKRLRLYMVFGGLIVLGFATVAILSALQQNLVFFITPSDLQPDHLTAGQRFRLGGLVADGSVVFDTNSRELRFEITDGARMVPVRHIGIPPDLFREGQGVVVEGRFSDNGLFVADTVLAKHDETYMPPEVAEALKERQLWKPDDRTGQ